MAHSQRPGVVPLMYNLNDIESSAMKVRPVLMMLGLKCYCTGDTYSLTPKARAAPSMSPTQIRHSYIQNHEHRYTKKKPSPYTQMHKKNDHLDPEHPRDTSCA